MIEWHIHAFHPNSHNQHTRSFEHVNSLQRDIFIDTIPKFDSYLLHESDSANEKYESNNDIFVLF